ncbi:hypothetical protein [Oleiagrimonas sp. C23AA]|uniref:hypothetical protein n=1 Tax=Oleiagrimonas sp. C23AA TaxID=2719047 RepID=UPI00141FF5AE|nr:hypothetical protein [Oleiagrimonas sp. C23AA]NII10399.1 hypothetical protein [Oleiagrimonas sp. C23AA]
MLLVCLALFSAGARAGIDVQADELSVGDMHFSKLHLVLSNDPDGNLAVTLDAASAQVPAMGWHHVAVHLQGQVTRQAQQRWQLAGALKLRHAPGGMMGDGTLNIAVDGDANTLEVSLSQAKAQASAALPLDMPTHAQVTLDAVPLGWLQGLLSQAWSAGKLKSGRVDGRLALDVLSDGVQTSGQFKLTGAGIDSTGGSIAAQKLSADGHFSLDTRVKPVKISVDTTLSHGQVLLGPLYAQLPSHPVRLTLTALAGAQGISLRDLRFSDPDALRLNGRIDFNHQGDLARLDLDHVQASFPAAYRRYARSWLDQAGFENLHVSGGLGAQVAFGVKGLNRLSLDANHMDVSDAQGRFDIQNLDGGIDWIAHGSLPATTLSWSALKLYRIPNGASTAHWQSKGGALALTQPLSVPVLGGQLVVSQLDWRPAASKGQRLDTALALTGINLKSLCKVLGWPQFPGTLAGSIPGLRYQNGRFDLDGGLSLNVFDGFVDVTRLSLEHPFGNAPVLAGDMNLKALDLAKITSVFDFGSITGRLHGHVNDLRLVDWSPVAFDAELLADSGGRISQRAVNNLTSVGGGGMAGGLQGVVLKLFDSFGYRRIGLRCKLQGSVCHMGGLEPDGNGFTIVEGRGLPHLSVIGHQRRVSWPTLVNRLEAATKSGGPVVR